MDEHEKIETESNDGKSTKTDHVIKLFAYIGTMSYVSLGYISRADIDGLYIRIVAFFFSISAISSLFCSIIIIANIKNYYEGKEKEWVKIGTRLSIFSFVLGVTLVAIDAVFL